MLLLKTNNAVRVAVGPFIDATDGITPELAVDVTACSGLLLTESDAGTAVVRTPLAFTASGGDNDLTHIANDYNGYYDLELTATQLNVLGRTHVSISNPAVHCPVFHDYMVVPANTYDSLISGNNLLWTDTVQMSGVYIDGVPQVSVTNKTGYSLVDGGSTVAVSGARMVEGAYDEIEALRLMLAVLVGKSSGGGTATITFRDTADGIDRVIATVDANGNRTVSPTLDVTI